MNSPAVLLAGVILFFAPLSGQELTSPRAVALGAYIAVSDDIFGVDWNLAATAFSTQKFDVAFASGPGIDGFEDFRLLSRPWSGHVFFFRRTPGTYTWVSVGRGLNPIIPQVPFDLLRSFTYQEDRGLGYAVRLNSELAAGLNVRRQRYFSALYFNGFWSANLNVSFRLRDNLNLGLVAENVYNYQYQKSPERFYAVLNDSTQFIDLSSEPFRSVHLRPEKQLNVGVAYRPWTRLLLAADVLSDGGFGVGFEWSAFKFLQWRMGLNRRSDQLYKANKASGLSVGLGVAYSAARFDLTFYHPLGHRDNRLVESSAGLFDVNPLNNSALLMAVRFALD